MTRRSHKRHVEVVGHKEEEATGCKVQLEEKFGEDETYEKEERKSKKRKKRNFLEKERCEPQLNNDTSENVKKEERLCKRKEDGMLEVKVENKKPVGMLVEERLVNHERMGKKLMERLMGKEEKKDMSERLGPMPKRARKRSW